MFNMFDMMGKVKEFQTRLAEAKEKLVQITHTSEAGAGMVKVTVNGRKQVIKLELDNDLIKPEDKEMLTDLILAATNKALAEVDELAKQHIQKATEGLIPNIPGLDIFKHLG